MIGPAPVPVRFGRGVCGDLRQSDLLEWLVTNSIGGYASGTVAGMRTRRYHGLLVAALAPPAGRTVLVTDVHEYLHHPLWTTECGAARWRDGAIAPRGFERLESFHLDGRTPVWRYVRGEHCVEKRIIMPAGLNTTLVGYRLVRGRTPLRLELRVLATYRDYHSTTRGAGWQMRVEPREGGIEVTAYDGARPIRITGPGMRFVAAHSWYEGFFLTRERERGLDAHDDALHVCTATVDLEPEQEVELALSTEPHDGGRRDTALATTDETVLAAYQARQGILADDVGARLALAADQFVVRRFIDTTVGATVIAGYHWFTDWGRDTMIALPGLTLDTGRPALARQILFTYAGFVDRGMVPNRFPDRDGRPEYNTVDATLWFIEALRLYIEATVDLSALQELWPVLEDIIDAHDQGTRYGIRVDAEDGLLRSGEDGVQLTWMDAKIGDWVVTPRTGKCVEINALWHSGLHAMAAFASMLGRPDDGWRARAERVRASFQRFWHPQGACLSDVLDGPFGDDHSVRPNQIFAVSLPASPLTVNQMRGVVEACGRSLLTSHGLRSLGPEDPRYVGRYSGSPHARDAAYHQGTVWGWLLGPFALAHHRVYGDPRQAMALLRPLVDHLQSYGVGTIAEVFDGDAPHRPGGCIAQAWSVAETLRAWSSLRRLEERS